MPDPDASNDRDTVLASTADADKDADRAEIAALRRRVAELERSQTLPLDDMSLYLRAIIDNSPAVIFIKDREYRYILINRRYEEVCHISTEKIHGLTDYQVFPADIADSVRANDKTVIESGKAIEAEEVVPSVDEPRTYLSLKFPIRDLRGAVIAVAGIATDITDRKRVERQQQIIDAQQSALRELSTPLIPLAEGVLAVPLIGVIDSARASQIMEVLLDGIGIHRARTAILDLTGVKGADADVANALIRTARAARLLGTEVILTGINPQMATSFIKLGIDLSGIVTRSTLQAGISYALAPTS